MSPLLWPAFLIAGLAEDWFITRYYLYVSSGRRGRAALLSWVISLYNFSLSLVLIVNRDVASAMFLAVGTGLGTWFAMEDRKARKRAKRQCTRRK